MISKIDLPKGIQEKLFYEKDMLKPFFKFENGKEVFLETLKTVYLDITSDYTVLIPKPGEFKTSKQLENQDFLIANTFSVLDFRSGKNDLDWIFLSFRSFLNDQNTYELLYSYFDQNFKK
jgi:hypothetical protein